MKSLMHVLIVAVLAGPVTLSCSKWNDPKEREDIVLTKVQQAILENGNVFAIDLFREMSREPFHFPVKRVTGIVGRNQRGFRAHTGRHEGHPWL